MTNFAVVGGKSGTGINRRKKEDNCKMGKNAQRCKEGKDKSADKGLYIGSVGRNFTILNVQLSWCEFLAIGHFATSPFPSSHWSATIVFPPRAGKPLEVLAVQFLPAGGRGVLHAAEDFLLDVGGQVGRGVLADLELAFEVLLDVAQPVRPAPGR